MFYRYFLAEWIFFTILNMLKVFGWMTSISMKILPLCLLHNLFIAVNGLVSLFKFSFVAFLLVTESCLTICNPTDWSLPGSSVHGIFRQEYWSGFPCPSPRDLPDPGIEPHLLLGRQDHYHWATWESPFSLTTFNSCKIHGNFQTERGNNMQIP